MIFIFRQNFIYVKNLKILKTMLCHWIQLSIYMCLHVVYACTYLYSYCVNFHSFMFSDMCIWGLMLCRVFSAHMCECIHIYVNVICNIWKILRCTKSEHWNMKERIIKIMVRKISNTKICQFLDERASCVWHKGQSWPTPRCIVEGFRNTEGKETIQKISRRRKNVTLKRFYQKKSW